MGVNGFGEQVSSARPPLTEPLTNPPYADQAAVPAAEFDLADTPGAGSSKLEMIDALFARFDFRDVEVIVFVSNRNECR